MEKMRSPEKTSKWIEVFTMGDLKRRTGPRRESDKVHNILNAHNESAMRLKSSTKSETLHPAHVDLMYRARRIPVRVSRSLPQRRRPLQKLPPGAGGEIRRWCACSLRNLSYNIARLRVRSRGTRALLQGLLLQGLLAYPISDRLSAAEALGHQCFLNLGHVYLAESDD